MGKLTDLDITGMIKLKGGQTLGKAHEHITAGILMRLGFDYMSLDYQGKPYDGIVVAYDKNPKENKDAKEIFLRAQIRTADKSVSFIGGRRAGVNREYKSGVKEYKYTTEHSDLIVGVDKNTLDLYLIPTRFISKWGNSRSLRKVKKLKNNWDILLNWNDDFLSNLEKELPP